MKREERNPESFPAPAPAARPARRWWLLFALLTAAYFGLFVLHPNLYFALGVAHYGAWFIDTFALLASNDAVSRGLNPYDNNPLDYFHRPHVYSHWWLHLRDLGLTRADTMRLGLGLVGAFLLAALARLRPASARQVWWYAAVLCSAPVLLAVDRGNNDLVIFVLLAPLVPCLLSGHRWVRLMAPFLVAAAAALKYYPATAGLVLLAAADRDELRPRLLVTGLLLTCAGLSVAGDLALFGPLAPQPEGLLSFAATGFFHELGWTGWAPKLVCAGAGLAAAVCFWSGRMLQDWEPLPARRSDWLHFVLGAALLTACFFTSSNFGYRWIFSIWLAPFLWMLPGDPSAPGPVRRLAHWTRWLLLAVLWWASLCCIVLNLLIGVVPAATVMRLASWSYLAEQPMDWAFFLCLLVFLVHFTRRRLAVLRRVQP